MANKQQILKDLKSGKSPIDPVKLMEVQNTITALKNNPKTVPLDQLIATKKCINDLLIAAPGFNQMLKPYIIKLDQGIEELSKIENNG